MYEAEGFIFDSKEMAAKATKEKEGIDYIRERTDLTDPEIVLSLYKKLNEDDIFETPVGYCFMVELANYLHSIPYFKNEDLPPVYVSTKAAAPVKQKKTAPDGKYKKKYKRAVFIVVVLALIIIGMFVINYISGNSVNILNYENAIIDKYESWELDLKEREAYLDERERALELNK